MPDLLDILLAPPTPAELAEFWNAARAPIAKVAPEERHYWRCPECLSVAATRGPLKQFPISRHTGMRALQCALCAAECEYLGRVNIRAQRLDQTSQVCACNEVCQSASGPNCSCICGGANHGVSVSVEVVTSTTAIPSITPVDPAAALRRRDEYRAALSEAKGRISWAYAAMERKRAGDWLGEDAYWRARGAIDALVKAKHRAQHGPRLKALAAVGRG